MSSLSQAATAAEKRTNARYWIVVMLFIVTSFNYGDRATLSIAGSEMARDIGLDPVGMGYVFSAFSWAYVIGQIPGGWLLDRFGSKRVYFWSIFIWSMFTPAAGLRRYLQRLWHYRCAVYPALPRRPCRVAVIPRQQPDRRRLVPGAGEGDSGIDF
ncbi:D-glucarate permease [Klebsiella pneumoniae]|nr:D-glucarate permease [Klebsiella pneumoniae]